MEVGTRSQGSQWRWPLLLSVVFLNLCLPNLVLSYGVLLVHALEVGAPQWLCFATPATFIVVYGLTQCWCRDLAESWGGPIGYRVMAATGLAVVVASLLASAATPWEWQPLVYGLLGGLGSSLISAQVDAVIFETYDLHLTLIRGICFSGQAVGQASFPHIITALVNHYGYNMSHIVLSAIMLQTLVAIMLLRTTDIVQRPIPHSRYNDRTYSIFSSGSSSYYDNELQLNIMNKKSWKNPSDENIDEPDFPDDVFDNDAYVTVTPPPSPEEKRRNLFGVEILPDIPEESEDSDVDEQNGTNKKRLSLAVKRFSAMGENFTEYITKQKSDAMNQNVNTNTDYQELHVEDNVVEAKEMQKNNVYTYSDTFGFRCQTAYAGMKRKVWMPSYKVYRLRRRTLFVLYSVNDTLFKPLIRSLLCWRFYPALLLCFTKLALTGVLIVLIPLMASRLNPRISITDANFLMTLHGFSWLCFLLTNPWLAQTPKRNFKYVTVIGLMMCTGACVLLSHARDQVMFAVGCVTAGFGYGTITSCWETATREFVGARLWPKLHSSLETLSSTSLAIFSTVMYFLVTTEGYDLQFCVFVLAVILLVTSLVWAIVSLVALYVTLTFNIKTGKVLGSSRVPYLI